MGYRAADSRGERRMSTREEDLLNEVMAKAEPGIADVMEAYENAERHYFAAVVNERAQTRVEYRTGLRLSLQAGPRTNLILTATYALVDSADGQSNTLTGRAELSHYFTDSFLARLIYQYQENDSDFRRQSYYENLIYFSLTKYFN